MQPKPVNYSTPIPLHEPVIDSEDIARVTETMLSGWVSSISPVVEEFELQCARAFKTQFALATVSGTAALHLGMESLKRIKNSTSQCDVIVPALSFIATANAVIQAGCHPILVDTDRNSFNLTPEMVRSFILKHYVFDSATGHWRAKETNRILLSLLMVHSYGWCCPIVEFLNLANEFNIFLFEDAAAAAGSTDSESVSPGEKSCGAVYSLNGNKIFTSGAGGIIVSNDSGFIKRARHLATQARTQAIPSCHDEPAFNYRMPGLSAALGISQLNKLEKFLSLKRAIFTNYLELFDSVRRVRVYQEAAGNPNHWLVNLVFENPTEKEGVLRALLDHSIMARPLWPPYSRQKALVGLEQYESMFPNSENHFNRTLSIPSSPGIPFRHQQLIKEIVCNQLQLNLQ